MTFNSDNISTIAILRDVISREASKRKLKVDVSTGKLSKAVVANYPTNSMLSLCN